MLSHISVSQSVDIRICTINTCHGIESDIYIRVVHTHHIQAILLQTTVNADICPQMYIVTGAMKDVYYLS
jgi:hypothetical protein